MWVIRWVRQSLVMLRMNWGWFLIGVGLLFCMPHWAREILRACWRGGVLTSGRHAVLGLNQFGAIQMETAKRAHAQAEAAARGGGKGKKTPLTRAERLILLGNDEPATEAAPEVPAKAPSGLILP